MKDMELWKPHRIQQGQCLEAQVGPLKLWLRRKGDELHVAVKRLTASKEVAKVIALHLTNDQELVDMDWGRWVCVNCQEVVLTPVIPDRPVVVRPETPVKIPPKQQALFFVGVPMWIRIAAGDGEQVQLCEEPSVTLSNIWFGDPMSGDLCYSLRSRARREISDSPVETHRAVCPVTISNTSIDQVEIERFCVHVEHLSVYLGKSRLWTNGVKITFKGEAEISQLEYSEKPPTYEAVDKVLSEPRTPVKKRLLKRSLGSFGLFGGA